MTVVNPTLDAGKAQASFMVGGLGAAAAFSGLYGPVAGVPTSLLSLMFLPAAFFTLLLAGTRSPRLREWLAIILSTIIYLLVLGHASSAQFAFMTDPAQWHFRQERYVDAKLLAISIAFIPQLTAITMIALVRDREKAIKGVFFALAALATLAALRILIEQGSGLIRTDKVTASNALLSSRYSLVSYGLLLTIGSVASLVLRRGWMLSGTLLFFAALIARRADVISLVACLIALSIYFGVTRGAKIGSKSLYSLILGATLFAGLHNDYDIIYFSGISRAIELRVGMISESLTTLSKEEQVANDSKVPAEDTVSLTTLSKEEQVANDSKGPDKDTVSLTTRSEEKQTANDSKGPAKDTGSSEHSTSRFQIFFGDGLGQYKNVTHSAYEYPHNIAFEILIELGVVAFFSFIILIFSPLTAIGSQAIRKKSSDMAIYSATCLCIAIAFSLKAGEMSDLGRIIFLSGLALLTSHSGELISPKRQPHR